MAGTGLFPLLIGVLRVFPWWKWFQKVRHPKGNKSNDKAETEGIHESNVLTIRLL